MSPLSPLSATVSSNTACRQGHSPVYRGTSLIRNNPLPLGVAASCIAGARARCHSPPPPIPPRGLYPSPYGPRRLEGAGQTPPQHPPPTRAAPPPDESRGGNVVPPLCRVTLSVSRSHTLSLSLTHTHSLSLSPSARGGTTLPAALLFVGPFA